MFEAHTGSRPGRPKLLLVSSAGVLAGMLGLAWWQAEDRRGLGDELRIAGTPLVVRAPRGWVQDPREPGLFALPSERDVPVRGEATLKRHVRFRYLRNDRFVPAEKILKWRNLEEWAKSTAPEPARVGPLAGIQVRRIVRRSAYGRMYLQEQVLRVACSARGDIIMVEYVPLTGLTVAQFELLDAVCAAIRLEDPAFTSKPAELLRHAGIGIPGDDSSLEVCGPDFPEVPGFYMRGMVDGVPVWALGVFRTWLAAGRTPADLLVDVAGEYWHLSPPDARVAESQRDDGAVVAALRHPAFGGSEHSLASVWLVSASAERTVLVLVFCGAGSAAVADVAARDLVQQIAIGPTGALPPLEDAAMAGRELAGTLRQQGGVPWWGLLPKEACYIGPQSAVSHGVYTQRVAIDDDPSVGYRGHTLHLAASERRPQLEWWAIDGRARGYTYKCEASLDTWSGTTPTIVEEQLTAGSATVTRMVSMHGRDRRWTFPVGPSFVVPPVESIAEAWVAQRDEGAWLIEATSHYDVGTHTRLLRPLPPDEHGHRRLLLLGDFWPRGVVIGFDADGELVYQLYPGGDYQRVTLAVAERHFRRLAPWRAELRGRLVQPPG